MLKILMFYPLICCSNFLLPISNSPNIIKKKQQKHIRSLKKIPTFDVRTHKIHYFCLKTYEVDGEIKNILIRYIHFVNGRIINHIKLLRTNKSKLHNFANGIFSSTLYLLPSSLHYDSILFFVNLVPSCLPFPFWLRRRRKTEHRRHHTTIFILFL